MSVSQIIAMQAGEWVKSFTATVSGSKSINCKSGKIMYVAKLVDGNDAIDAQSFDLDFSQYEGQRVEFGGKGMKRDEYNGYAKLAVGKGVVVRAGGGGAAPEPMKPVATFDISSYLAQCVQLRIKCEHAAQEVAAEFDGNLDASHVQVIASGFFISMTRKLGL